MDLCCKSSEFANFENWADRGSAVIFEADSGLWLSYVPTLGPKRNLDHISFFSLDRYVNEFIQIISFFRKKFILSQVWDCYLNFVLCCCHQARSLLYYFGKINSGIHMYQFIFEPLHLCFRLCLWFRIWTKILADRRIWRKKDTDRRICIPLFTPLLKHRRFWATDVNQKSRLLLFDAYFALFIQKVKL